MKQTWSKLEARQIEEVRRFIDKFENPGYLVVGQGEIPQVISPRLIEKSLTAVAMTSTGANGTTIVTLNLNRFDAKDQAIDQQPFGIALLSTGGAASGVILDHGDWNGRTQHLRAYGLEIPFLSIEPERKTGSLNDLIGTSHGDAFFKIYETLLKEGQADS